MGAVNLRMMGRWGNQLFQYAFARAYCERGGHELRCYPWDGERVFDLGPCARVSERFEPCYSEQDYPKDFRGDIELHGYFQSQDALIYTRTQAKEWLKLKYRAWYDCVIPRPQPIAHYRCGDYLGYGYPVISKNAIIKAATDRLIATPLFFSEEDSHPAPEGEPTWLSDFVAMRQASILFRANSSFSWWAATLADKDQIVYSPLIDGLEGGKEHDDVPFVLGNYPRLASLPFTTDLHLAP